MCLNIYLSNNEDNLLFNCARSKFISIYFCNLKRKININYECFFFTYNEKQAKLYINNINK